MNCHANLPSSNLKCDPWLWILGWVLARALPSLAASCVDSICHSHLHQQPISVDEARTLPDFGLIIFLVYSWNCRKMCRTEKAWESISHKNGYLEVVGDSAGVFFNGTMGMFSSHLTKCLGWPFYKKMQLVFYFWLLCWMVAVSQA